MPHLLSEYLQDSSVSLDEYGKSYVESLHAL